MRKVQILLIIALLPCLLPRLLHFFVTAIPIDFDAYYTAAVLAREHQGMAIYSGADTGQDPQRRLAGPGTVFAKTANRVGAVLPNLYVYPPILADMLIPITIVPLGTAFTIWTVINYGLLPIIAAVITRLLRLRWLSWGSLVVFLAAVSFRPIVIGIFLGQVVIVLLLLWACGILFYMKGFHNASGAAFALAIAIKLTPLIVIAPLLIWKEWKILRGILVSLVFLALLICIINTPASLIDYFAHVMPAMSHGPLFVDDLSLSSSVELVLIALNHKILLENTSVSLATGTLLLGKLCAVAILAVACLLTYRNRRNVGIQDRLIIISLFAMLSACLAPVSWVHAYSICLIALSFLWAEALRKGIPDGQLVVLFVCTFLLTSYLGKFSWILSAKGGNSLLYGVLMLSTPFAGSLLALERLAVFGRNARHVEKA
jgi:hypothetical protein